MKPPQTNPVKTWKWLLNIVLIQPDISKVFTSSEQVNKALRVLIPAMPEKKTVAGK
jgi:hypothetical protein